MVAYYPFGRYKKIVIDVKLDVNHSKRWNISANQSKGIKLVA